MSDEQFIEITYHLDRIAMAVEALAVANNPQYEGFRTAGYRMAEAKRAMNARRLKSTLASHDPE